MTINPISDVKVRVGWPFAMDGTESASGYGVGLWKEWPNMSWAYSEQYVGNVIVHEQTTAGIHPVLCGSGRC